jgi:23S rRNA (cytosine1962-C5)-methyltransferase
LKAIYLKSGREKSVLRHHPWIFSGAIDHVTGEPSIGDTLDVFDAQGTPLGKAAYSPSSSIRARIWTFDPIEEISLEYFSKRIHAAISMRNDLQLFQHQTNIGRLIHAESDGLPGLIVDRYDNLLVVQILSAGIEKWREVIFDILKEETGIENILERSDVEVRKLEGLEERTGIISGQLPQPEIEIVENGIFFYVDVVRGQKTGFYIDQRLNRRAIQDFSKGKDVLNCFSYTGAFSVNALKAGASHVTSIDSSVEANQLAFKNLALNNIPPERYTILSADVFHELRTMRDKALSFDLIILDPPKFAPTAAQVRSAARGYKDINLLAFKLLRPGGILATFSCSGGVTQELFQKIVADAALDAGVDAKIIQHLAQGPDHPIALNFPEGSYLKGLTCMISK